MTPNGTYAYVGLAGTNEVDVIETATNTVVATISVGSAPGAIVISPILLAPSSLTVSEGKNNFGLCMRCTIRLRGLRALL